MSGERRDDEVMNGESSPKRLKLETSPLTARRKRDLERQVEKERKEAERKAEKERKEAERKAEKERKEAERKAERIRKEAEKIAEKERRIAEKLAEKERKLAEKEAKEQAEAKRKQKDQPKINLFFKKDNSIAAESPIASQCDVLNSSPEKNMISDYRKSILPFQPKTDGKVFSLVCNFTGKINTDDPYEFLKSLPKRTPKITLSNEEFSKRLALTRESSQVEELISQLRIRRLQFSHLSSRHIHERFQAGINAESRPPYIGTSRDICLDARKLLAIDPTRVDLDPNMSNELYEYDSEAEWGVEEGEDLNEEDEESDEELDSEIDELKEFYISDEEESAKRPKFIGPLVPVVVWGHCKSLDSFNIICENMISPNKKPENTENTEDYTENDLEVLLKSCSLKIDIEEFKKSLFKHVDSNSTKTLIVELLKAQFPNANKEIKQLFDLCMERVGKKRNEKKWVLTERAISAFNVDKPHN